MRILLVGEYSRLHNSLKEGLLKNGHEVLLLGTGDGFKNYPCDISVKLSVFSIPFFKWIAKIFDKLFNIQLIEFEYLVKLKKIIPDLKGFDVVQLINEQSLKTSPDQEIKLISQLKNQNKSLFLLSCGTDYVSVKHALDNKFRYSILTPYLNDTNLKKKYRYILKYVTPPYKKLHDFLYENINGVISSDLDYHIPLQGNAQYLGLIPNPINTDTIKYVVPNISNKIIIFHGINRMNYMKKGNHFFEKALKVIGKKYNERVEIITVENLPYKEYTKALNSCHIILDQVYAYDQGYNALEAMAKGKVVFTGAEKEWIDHYQIEEDTIAINALPDVDYIVDKLEWLIDTPEKIEEISQNARNFIEQEHNYKNIANLYMKRWKDDM